MKDKELIHMLNQDLADEHAAILRYLIHSYLEGEDTSIGASLLSRAREEMWHMHWLGMIICQLGGEPNFVPAEYPYDSSNRSTIFKSYIEYESKLIPHYNKEAEKINDPHIKRVLQREAWESAFHAQKFQKILDKLSPEEANGSPGADERELPKEFLQNLQFEIADKYNEMLQHIRHSWCFKNKGILSWQLMDQAMEKMKHLAHFAEDVAESGLTPKFQSGHIEATSDLNISLQNLLENHKKTYLRHIQLKENQESQKHKGFILNLDLTIQQEKYQISEIEEWIKIY